MRTLSDSFLQYLVGQLDDENTIGMTLTGSYARGEGGPYSDVDVLCYVRNMPSNAAETSFLRFMEGCLVSVSLVTLESVYDGLRTPKEFIRAVPGLRQSRILLDKDGSIAALKEYAVKLPWQGLQTSANAYASWNLSGCTEEVFKILAGLAQRDESKTLYAVWGLTHELANTLLIQCGTLIPTENAYIDLAQQTAGRASGWTRQFRLAVGLDLLQQAQPPYLIYGAASLRLYRETAGLLQDFLLPEHAAIVTQTLASIAEAGY